jgi:hypothetical protein
VEGGLGESAASTIACNDIRRPRKDSIASGKVPFLACKKEVGDFKIPVTGFLMRSGAQGFGPCLLEHAVDARRWSGEQTGE